MPDNTEKRGDPLPDYEKAEMDLLRETLKRSYKERFLMATRLHKIEKTMEKAVITHKPGIKKVLSRGGNFYAKKTILKSLPNSCK